MEFDTENSSTNSSTERNNGLPSVKESLNDFFKIKLAYETQIMENKKKIMHNFLLSNREKRAEFLKLKPKCINCGRPGGTRFQTTFIAESDNEDAYRQHSATCGVIANPCPLQIKIQLGKVELLPNLLNSLQNSIKDKKDEVIDNKNKLLFGYLTTEEVLSKFDDLKDSINDYTTLYEAYLDTYHLIVDNDRTKEELGETTTNIYIQINQIKDCIKKMNDTNNVQYARDAVNIYTNTLVPLMNKSRVLKYDETMVWRTSEKNHLNTCNLIQNKNSIRSLSYSSFQDRVVAYNVGVRVESNNERDVQRPIVFDEVDEVDDGIQIQGCPSKGKLPQPCRMKKDYYNQTRIFHPDKNPGCIENSTEKFKILARTPGCAEFANN